MVDVEHDRVARAALLALMVVQIAMLTALYAGVAPHPPRAVPLFALGPFLAASLGVAAFAWSLTAGSIRWAHPSGVAAALLALVSLGPHKFFDASAGEIWPALLVGQAAAAIIIVRALPARRRPGDTQQ